MGPADRAFGVFPQLQLAESYTQGIKHQEAPDKWLSLSNNQLNRFHRLDATDDSGQDTQDPAFRTTGYQSRRRRLGIQASVTGPFLSVENGYLPLETEDAPVNIRFAKQHAGIIHQIAGGEVVSAVHNNVIAFKKVERIVGSQARWVSHHFDVWIDLSNGLLRRNQFRPSHIRGAVNYLALQVGKVHHIEVHDAKPSNPSGGEVKRQRRSKPSCTNAEYVRFLQLKLPFHADFRHDEVAAVTKNFILAQLYSGIQSRCSHFLLALKLECRGLDVLVKSGPKAGLRQHAIRY